MGTEARRRTVRWRALAWSGWEHLDLSEGPDDVVARSTVIGEFEGTRYGIFYEVRLTPAWEFRSIALQRTDGRTFALHSDGEGNWTGGDGTPLPDLAGCIDIDLSGSPFTNTLPVRRAAFETGVPSQFRMAWIPFDSFAPFPDEQIYTRLDDGRFHYQSGDGSFECEVAFDGDGLVTDYPGLFERLP